MLIIKETAGASVVGAQKSRLAHGEVTSDDAKVGTEDLEADYHENELTVFDKGTLG